MAGLIWIIAIAALMFYTHRNGGGCCGGHSTHEQPSKGEKSTDSHEEQVISKEVTVKDTVQDPACGMYLSPDQAIKRSIGRQVFFFCSEECAAEFEEANRLAS